MFFIEFLSKISQNEDGQKDKFNFIKDSLTIFDRIEETIPTSIFSF